MANEFVGMSKKREQESQDEATVRETTGTVLQELPNQLFRLRLESGHVVGAAVTGRHAMDFLRLRPGDRVRVNLSPTDATRGRIIARIGQ